MLRRILLRSLQPHARAVSSVPPLSYSNLQSSSAAIAPQSVNVPQAPNHPQPWSTSQRPRPAPASEPRFEQTDMALQPSPLSAMELINNEPVRLVQGRRAVCDGGGGPLGHPKIFINLDKPGPKPCGYWQVLTLNIQPPPLNDPFAAAFASSKTERITINSLRGSHPPARQT